MNDTLGLILNTLQESKQNNLEVLTKVNEFYDSAWNKLVLVGTIITGFLGVVMPFAINYYQKKILKSNKDEIKKELLTEITKDLKKVFNEYDTKIIKLEANSKGAVFILQGNNSFNNGNFKDSLEDFNDAANCFFDGNDNEHLLEVLDFMAVTNIPNINVADLKDLENQGKVNFDKLFKKLNESKDKDFYIKAIEKIKDALKVKRDSKV